MKRKLPFYAILLCLAIALFTSACAKSSHTALSSGHQCGGTKVGNHAD